MTSHGDMNRVFRLVWSKVTGQWVAVSELTRGRSKSSRSLRVAAAGLALATTGALAGPLGGKVTAGSAGISSNGTTTTINQGSQNLSLTWSSFNVGAQETVNFLQPNAAAIAVNRIGDVNGSQILGHLNANGQVYLINPNGVLFGRQAVVNVGGMVASTLDIGDAGAFGASRTFSGPGTGSVVKQGSLTAAPGGYVALLGNQVSNQGVVQASLGSVAMAAGSAMTLKFAGNSLVSLNVDQSTLNNLVDNKQLLQADGGQVLMSAGAADALLASVVNNTGVVQAMTVQNHQGTIVLLGGAASGQVNLGGTLDVSAAQGRAGTVTATGQSVAVLAGARVDARGGAAGGTIQIGSGWEGGGGIAPATTVTVASGAELNASATRTGDGGTVVVRSDVDNPLSTTVVAGVLSAGGGAGGGNGGRIETSAHLLDVSGARVDASAAHGAAGTWLLDPFNIDIVASGSASLTTSGGTASLTAVSTSTISASAINAALNAGNNVTITATGSTSNLADILVDAAISKTSGAGNVTLTLQATDSIIVNQPISSTAGTGNTGKLNITLLADNDHDGVGINMIRNNLGTGGGNLVLGANVSGTYYGGGTYIGSNASNGANPITLSTSGGNLTINGPLIIANPVGLTVDTYTGYDVAGFTQGGNATFNGTIDSGDSYALNSSSLTWDAARTTAQTGTGANTGDTYLATITSSLENAVASYYAGYSAAWLGAQRVTGLSSTTLPLSSGGGAGATTSGAYNINSIWRWVTGPEGQTNVDGNRGLPFFAQNGSNTANGSGGYSIAGRYANWNSGEPNNYQASNLTVVNENVLQFVGNAGQWNDLPHGSGTLPFLVETNLANSPLTINAIGGTVNFTGNLGSNKSLGNFSVTAGIINLPAAPVINSGSISVTGNVYAGGVAKSLVDVQADSTTISYGASPAYSVTCSGADCSNYAMSNVTVTPSATVSGTGIYYLTPSGLSATGNDLIVYSNGTLTVAPKALSVSGTSVASKVYDGTTTATLSSGSLVGVINSDTVTLTQAGAFGSKNAGTGLSVTAADTLGGTNAANYSLVQPTGLTADITPKSLTVNGTATSAGSKVYDGTTTVTLAGLSLSGVIGGDTVGISGSLASKDVANGIHLSTAVLTGSSAANYSITSPNVTALTANVTPKSITVTASGSNKVYDGNTTASVTLASSGLIGGDSVSFTDTAANYASKNAANGIAISVTGIAATGANASDYAVASTTASTSGNITAKPITVVAAVNGGGKTYDGSNAATVSLSSSGVVGADVVTFSKTSATYAGSSAAAGVTVTVSGIGESGANAGNYSLQNTTATATGTISPAPLTVGGSTAVAGKVYDGTTAAALSGGVLGGTVYGSDSVSLVQGGTFASKNVGNGIAVTPADSLSGAAAGNYVLTQPTGSFSASITAAPLSVAATAVSKTYDGTTGTLGATPVVGTLAGAGAGETLFAPGSQAYADKNAGSGKTVLASGVVIHDGGGNDTTANYAITYSASSAGTILAAPLTVTATTVTKTYDGTVNAAGLPTVGTLAGAAAGESLDAVGSQAFNDKNAGTGKTVLARGVTVKDAGGTDVSANYSITYVADTGSVIQAAPLTITATGATKTYDGTVNAPGASPAAGPLAGAAVGEFLAQRGQQAYSDPNAGSGKTVNASGAVIKDSGGNDVTANYAITYVPSNAGLVNPASLTVVANNDARFVAESDPANFAGVSYKGFVNGETASVLNTSGLSVARSNASQNAAGSYTGVLVPAGLSSNNYNITYLNGDYTIVPADTLLVKMASTTSTYGSSASYALQTARYWSSTLNQAVDLSSNSAVAQGVVTVNDGAGGVANVPVTVLDPVHSGSGQLAAGGYQLGSGAVSGSNLGNFSNNVVLVGSNTVVPQVVTVSGTALSKVYDGSTAVSGFSASIGAAAGDVVSILGSGAFSSADAGSGKSYSIGNMLLGGADAGNYVLANPAATLSGSAGTVTPAVLTVAGSTAASKPYDGSTAANVSGGTLVGVVGGDAVSLAQAGSFVSKNAGAAVAVTAADSIAGAAAGNYTLVQPTGINADILPKALTVNGTAVAGKTYDGTTVASLSGGALVGVVGSDAVALAQAGSFAGKNAGTGIAVTASDSLTGADAGNYTVTQPTGLSASIAPKGVSVSGTAVADKTYDGTAVANLSGGSLVGVVAGDSVALNQAGSYASKNAGASIAVTASNTLGGADAGNYALIQPTGLSAGISPATLSVSAPAVTMTYNGGLVTGVAPQVGALAGAAAGETLSGTGTVSFSDKNVGTGKALTPAGVTVKDAAGNDVTGNYAIAYVGNNGGTITRLASVTWTGGATGNWFDPANWAGGAVPDLSNVAGVVIPTGVTVSFNNTAVAPAQAGPVNIDSLGSAGSLALGAGILNVGAGGVALSTLGQSGGTLNSTGAITLGSFTQSGGATSTGADFSTGTQFTQSGSGSLVVGGSANLASTTGGVVLGQLNSAGNLSVSSTGGAISQATGTQVTVRGTGSFSASSGGEAADIGLANNGNLLGSPVSLQGANVAVSNSGPLLLGTVSASGDLSAASTGALNLGTASVAGKLNVASSNGDVTQTGPLLVGGTSSIDAGTGTINLPSLDNRLQGQGQYVATSKSIMGQGAGVPVAVTGAPIITTLTNQVTASIAQASGTGPAGTDLLAGTGAAAPGAGSPAGPTAAGGVAAPTQAAAPADSATAAPGTNAAGGTSVAATATTAGSGSGSSSGPGSSSGNGGATASQRETLAPVRVGSTGTLAVVNGGVRMPPAQP